MPAPTTPQELTLTLGLGEADDTPALRRAAAAALSLDEADLPPLRLLKRSIDARHGRVRFHLLVHLGGEPPGELGTPHPREVALPSRVVIVGDGPAGLFCAYELARHGIASTVLDRGKPVQPRRHDLKGLNSRGEVDADSNYCFGEGGAGTYSDGKLYTRAHKRGDVRDVIELLVRHGAPDTILTDARPHIGSNRLPKVVSGLREALETVGVEFRFGARVTDLLVEDGRVAGVQLAGGQTVPAEHVVLATGHSAADVYRMLAARGVALEAKAFALGVRIEHPQGLINHAQYGRDAEHPSLPAAPYRLAQTVDERGVFSFCMCPGGFIVPAATEASGLVVNGMSLSRRSSRFANSGLVVGVETRDVQAAGFEGVLGGIELQRKLEATALQAGGGLLRAPATRATDFLAGRGSSTLPECSYLPGLTGADVGEVLDVLGLRLAQRIRQALSVFDRRIHGYASQDAVLVGVESRTSSPVRIPRDKQSLQSPDMPGLYPAGEGAGYAGGIMSAAMDGMRIARVIAARQ